jgi:hypothetical protein
MDPGCTALYIAVVVSFICLISSLFSVCYINSHAMSCNGGATAVSCEEQALLLARTQVD